MKTTKFYLVTDDSERATVSGPMRTAEEAKSVLAASRMRGVVVESREVEERTNAFTGATTLGESVSVAGSDRERVFTKHIKSGNVSRISRPAEALDRLDAGVYMIYQDFDGNTFLERKNVRTDDLLKFDDERAEAVTNEISRFWDLKESYGELGLTHKRGVLLYGAPGTGKSMLLKQVVEGAVAKDTIVIYPKELRALARMLREFRDVEPERPVLVVLEDVDGLIQYDEHSLLELFDGDDQLDHVLYLATTNYPDRLPPRVMRSGRFDTKIEIKNPPKAGRAAYLTYKLSGRGVTAEQIDEYADLTEDFSFAQMREFLAATFAHGQDAKAAITRIRRNFTESRQA